MLKVRSSKIRNGSNTAAPASRSSDSNGAAQAPSSIGPTVVQGARLSDSTAGAVHVSVPGGYSLLKHLETLAVAAQETGMLVQLVSCLASV